MMFLVGLVLSLLICIFLALRFYISSGAQCKLKARLEGKVIVITGGNSGIGKAASLELARRGATVILACRNKIKAEATVTQLRKKSGSDQIYYLPLDLTSLQYVSEFVDMFIKRFGSAFALVNNAAYLGPKGKTADGFDLGFQTNYLSHFYLTQLLISRSKPNKSRPLRIINITSDSYRTSHINFDDLMMNKSKFDIYQAYGTTKLAMVWFSNELNYRHSGGGISSVAVHPGAVKTKLLRNWPGLKGDLLRFASNLLFRTPEIGAQSIIFSLTVDHIDNYTGKLIYDCKGIDLVNTGKNYKAAEQLWNVSWTMCDLDAGGSSNIGNGIQQ